ncbi:uncharacterized protein SPSK_01851 [Sporothrix schenckii 1099-18]|uniref:Uncharacterized protein n=1 Tax=Sporothrix schenckii 1099-18 TaxID=1397361 RepID=A0A0F2MGU4_SPOSC|nr:uncharacterized protein SPSK_01851 [Sporothrix schenckii 1099-18]KJR87386.1 hypothetical protein SPSK_01851 [Sporothrix schenckii 1099-18]
MSVSEQFVGGDGVISTPIATGVGTGEKAEVIGHRTADAKPSGEYASILADTPLQADEAGVASRGMYSPLTSLCNEPRFATMRRGHKVMVGQNGWLERPGSIAKKPEQPKKAGFFDSLKRIAKEVADATEMKSSRRVKGGERGRASSRVRISLDPREQSLLYCELEFLLTSALDCYINSQFNAGRLDADKYKKVVDAWHQKGRPKVVGFRYDLETQLDLVFLHMKDFRFYGDRASVPAAISGILEAMRVNARALRVRTFCQPDSVMAKQLLDSQSLLNLLGSAEQRQIQLAEVVQFFKIVLEREHKLQRTEEVRGLPQ